MLDITSAREGFRENFHLRHSLCAKLVQYFSRLDKCNIANALQSVLMIGKFDGRPEQWIIRN